MKRIISKSVHFVQELINAHRSVIGLYDSLNDEVTELSYVDYVSKFDEDESKKKAKEMKDLLNDSKTDRSLSSFWRAFKHIVESRFQPHEKDDSSDIAIYPFAKRIKEEIDKLPETNDIGKETKDLISVLLEFHGRPLGILHVDSIFDQYLTYEKRAAILEFKTMIEEEFYEKRLNDFLDTINRILGESLNKSDVDSEKNFYNRLARSLCRLLGAKGAIIGLKGHDKYKIKGVAGEKISDLINGEISIEDEIIGLIIRSSNVFMIDLNKMNDKKESPFICAVKNASFNSCYYIPKLFQDENPGFIMFFDCEKNPYLSSPLKKELEFIGNEVFQIITHYIEHRKSLDNFYLLTVHDLLGFHKSIDTSCESLKAKYPYLLPDKHRMDFNKNIDDIINQSEASIELYKFVATNSGKTSLETNNMLKAYLYLLGEKGRKDIVNFYKLINSTFKSRELDLMRLNLNYKDNYERHKFITFESEVILHELAFVEVMNNLINNIEKYSIYGTPVKIDLDYVSDFYYRIHIKNQANKLPKKFAENPDLLFKLGERVDESKPGIGAGLYITRQLTTTWGGYIYLVYKQIDNKHAEFDFIIELPDNKGE